jgi:tetratricopeptide (TPR) repeat protein
LNIHEAIAKDPDFAAAYSGLSDALIGQIFTGTPSSEVRDKATQAAEKSIELDPSLAEAHDSLGIIRELYDWDWAGAESEYRRAIELNRNFAHAHQDYALFLMTQGRFDQSMEEAQRAQDLDPLSSFIRTTYCLGLSIARRYEQAAQKCQEALELDPNFLHAHGNLAGIYVAMGLPERGVDEYQKAASLRGANPTEVADTQKVFQKGGMRALWRKWLKPGPSATGRDDSMEVAALYSLLNEKDQTFAWLERAYQQRSPLMEFLKEDPDFDNVRSDPRYGELLRKVGLDR